MGVHANDVARVRAYHEGLEVYELRAKGLCHEYRHALVQACKALGLSQKDLAAGANLSAQYVNDILLGRRRPSAAARLALVQALLRAEVTLAAKWAASG